MSSNVSSGFAIDHRATSVGRERPRAEESQIEMPMIHEMNFHRPTKILRVHFTAQRRAYAADAASPKFLQPKVISTIGNVMRNVTANRHHEFYCVVAVHNVARLAAQLSAPNGT
jgi:hypothetical protein